MKRLSEGISYWVRGYPVMFWLMGVDNLWLGRDKAGEIRRRLRAMRKRYG